MRASCRTMGRAHAGVLPDHALRGSVHAMAAQFLAFVTTFGRAVRCG